MNGAIIPNHGFILLDSIGESNESLLCLTDFPACCRANYTDDKGHLGDWFFPNETMVPNMVLSMGDEWEFYRTRGRMMVFLHRRRGGVNGIYHCMVPDQSGDQLRLYVGVYTSNTGRYFQDHHKYIVQNFHCVQQLGISHTYVMVCWWSMIFTCASISKLLKKALITIASSAIRGSGVNCQTPSFLFMHL